MGCVMLRHGKDYLASLRDGRRIRLGTELVTDVTTHPAFKNTAQSFARIYDLKRSPENIDYMSYEEGGQRYSAWFMPPRSKDDLRLRAEAHRRVAEWSCGLLGRSMDHVPSFIAGMSMKPELFDANRQGFGQNIIDYLDYLRKGDLFACYLVLTPRHRAAFLAPPIPTSASLANMTAASLCRARRCSAHRLSSPMKRGLAA
jgi:4-hydroxyphenylacetate 3-monooxygenase